MSCVLRAGGRTFDVRGVLLRSKLVVLKVHRRGEPRVSSRPEGPKNTRSSLHVLVSDRDFSEFGLQVRDAIRFLQKHSREWRREPPRVEGATEPQNKGMKLASVERIGRSHILSVRRSS